jgi:hypothetical protein
LVCQYGIVIAAQQNNAAVPKVRSPHMLLRILPREFLRELPQIIAP